MAARGGKGIQADKRRSRTQRRRGQGSASQATSILVGGELAMPGPEHGRERRPSEPARFDQARQEAQCREHRQGRRAFGIGDAPGRRAWRHGCRHRVGAKEGLRGARTLRIPAIGARRCIRSAPQRVTPRGLRCARGRPSVPTLSAPSGSKPRCGRLKASGLKVFSGGRGECGSADRAMQREACRAVRVTPACRGGCPGAAPADPFCGDEQAVVRAETTLPKRPAQLRDRRRCGGGGAEPSAPCFEEASTPRVRKDGIDAFHRALRNASARGAMPAAVIPSAQLHFRNRASQNHSCQPREYCDRADARRCGRGVAC